MSGLRYGIPFLALATTLLGIVLGDGWCWLTVIATPAGLLLFDWWLGGDRNAAPAPDAGIYRLLPWLYIPLQIATIVVAALTVSRPGVGFADAAGLTASVGVTAGVFGMLAAHEMVHSQRRAERALGLMMLSAVGYMHFRIAHLHGHHRRAATWEDPATARAGENAYAFLARSVAGQWREAWSFERQRLTHRGRGALSPFNRMIHYLLFEALVVAGVASLGPAALLFWLAQASLAIGLLEVFNYVAHYGLSRRRLPSGGIERIGPRHSWNASRRMNNWSLFNMGRHADHHRFAARAYQCLEATPGSPELPGGYAAAVLLAMAPPLWRRVMDPRAEFWMAGD